ncbi:MAG: DUF11 domain-containing protein, partial [Oscillospiraceae bacterium]
NTAAVTGRYSCAPGCSGEIAAVSEPVVTHLVDVALDKTVRPACARCGQTVHCTITLCNRSSVPVQNLRLTDPDTESLLDVGTVFYNGQPIRDGSLGQGVLIPGIGAGCRAVLTFDAVVPEGAAGLIAGTACAEFEFSAAACKAQRAAVVSNEAVLRVISPRLEIRKSADRCAVTPQEPSVTYTLTVRNTGTCPLSGVTVTDALSPGLVYVPGSTTVNDGPAVNLDPAAGIPLGELEHDGIAVVTFRAAAAF